MWSNNYKRRVCFSSKICQQCYCMSSVNMMGHKFLPLSCACFACDVYLPCLHQCLFILAITQSGQQLHAPSIWVDGGRQWPKHSSHHITVALSPDRKWKRPSKQCRWQEINQPVAVGCVNISVWSGWMMTARGQCRSHRVMHTVDGDSWWQIVEIYYSW